MQRGEKKSFFRFLIIYIISTMTLFSLAALLFYTYEKHRLLDLQRDSLETDSELLTVELRELHEEHFKQLIYPSSSRYVSAIFDIDKRYIFGDFKPTNVDFTSAFKITNGTLLHVKSISPYYLGTAYLVLQKPIDQTPLNKLFYATILFLLVALLLFLILGYFLGRLFIAPMRESFEKMNQFIQDTTHELNTPISTILTNIELLDTLYECDGKKERKRIEIASKTLSRLYDDLTYIKLNYDHHRDIKLINIAELLEERLLYFDSMIEAKNIAITNKIDQNTTIMIDENDALRLIDNLLSNAIKYNKQKGILTIILHKDYLSIEDSGVGMSKDELMVVLRRYERSNKSEGGFGIGLDIVSQIVSFYDLNLKIESAPNIGTKVIIQW